VNQGTTITTYPATKTQEQSTITQTLNVLGTHNLSNGTNRKSVVYVVITQAVYLSPVIMTE